jgi:hypothetical protein
MFGGERRLPTRQEIIDHLSRLEGGQSERAEEYVRLAPRQITTPHRTAIEAALGWTPLSTI